LNNIVNIEKGSINTCDLCGNIISGKKDKKFCNKKEKPNCFKRRRASDKRKEKNNRGLLPFFHKKEPFF